MDSSPGAKAKPLQESHVLSCTKPIGVPFALRPHHSTQHGQNGSKASLGMDNKQHLVRPPVFWEPPAMPLGVHRPSGVPRSHPCPLLLTMPIAFTFGAQHSLNFPCSTLSLLFYQSHTEIQGSVAFLEGWWYTLIK